MVAAEKYYTSADLLALPDDDLRHELDDGILFTMIPPAHKHALLSGELFGDIFAYNKIRDLGIVTGSDGGYRLHIDPISGRETVYVPDVAFVVKARKTKLIDDLFPGAPDLAIEVISPSETVRMITRKLRNYFVYGTRAVWLVYPDAKVIEVYTGVEDGKTLTIADTLDGGDNIPGFTLTLQELFAVLD